MSLVGVRIDIETRSSVDLKRSGVYPYAESPDFAVLLISYAPLRSIGGGVKMGRPRLLDLSDRAAVKRFTSILVDPSFQKHAYNAQFERVCLSKWIGLGVGDYIDPENWHCAAIRANVNGVQGSLDEVARALRSPIRKDKEGGRLIRVFSLPRKNGGFNEPEDHPGDFAKFGEYCDQDVLTEAGVAALLPDVPDEVQAQYEMDQRINDRGFRHYRELSEKAVEQVTAEQARLMGELKNLTHLDNPNSIQQMRAWLDSEDYPMDSLNKASREEALADPLIPPIVARALELRGAASLSSVAKHKAALATRCEDGRIRGSLQFYGAHTGREAGRGIQPQNLPRYEAPEEDRERLLLGTAGRDAPTIAKGTVRSSIIPAPGHEFVVFDYNAIEARCLGWQAGESWVEAEFRGEGKIYEATAATMFGIDKAALIAGLKACGKCGSESCPHCSTRGRGKVACIAEGQLVLTERRGLVPIERVSRNDRVWDGVEWVSHEGVVCLGMKEVITHDGLTATPDHRVWCPAGDGSHVAFGDAAARGDGLVQSGTGRNPVSVGGRYRDRAQVHQTEASGGVRSGPVRRLLSGVLVSVVKRAQRHGWLRLVRGGNPPTADVAGPAVNGSEATMHQPPRSGVPELWREGDRVPVLVGARGWPVDDGESPERRARLADRPRGQRRALRTGEPTDGQVSGEREQPTLHKLVRVRPGLLALRRVHGAATAVIRAITGSDHRSCQTRSLGEAEGVATDRVEARVYDLLNAGPRHRFTVSGRLVHNCLALGYMGGAGALVTMGAASVGIDVGNYVDLSAEWERAGKPCKFHEWERDRHDYPELLRLRDLYRSASPMTVRFWKLCAAAWDRATAGGGLQFGPGNSISMIRDGRHNRLILPSGRSIWYRNARTHWDEKKPDRVDRRTFIGKAQGVGHARIDTHGGKLTENITQAVARDALFDLMLKIERLTRAGWPGRIVLHVHDEVVLEVPSGSTQQVYDDIKGLMAESPAWAPGLILRGEGAVMDRYRK